MRRSAGIKRENAKKRAFFILRANGSEKDVPRGTEIMLYNIREFEPNRKKRKHGGKNSASCGSGKVIEMC